MRSVKTLEHGVSEDISQGNPSRSDTVGPKKKILGHTFDKLFSKIETFNIVPFDLNREYYMSCQCILKLLNEMSNMV